MADIAAPVRKRTFFGEPPALGYLAFTEIWERFSIRSLFVSANLDSAARSRAAAANPIGFLEKPFSRANLLAAVAAAH